MLSSGHEVSNLVIAWKGMLKGMASLCSKYRTEYELLNDLTSIWMLL